MMMVILLFRERRHALFRACTPERLEG